MGLLTTLEVESDELININATYGKYSDSYNVTIKNTMGNTEIYDKTSVSPTRRAMPVSFTEDGDIQSLTIYHNGGTGHVLLGVYSDATGAPSSLLGITSSTTVNAQRDGRRLI